MLLLLVLLLVTQRFSDCVESTHLPADLAAQDRGDFCSRQGRHPFACGSREVSVMQKARPKRCTSTNCGDDLVSTTDNANFNCWKLVENKRFRGLRFGAPCMKSCCVPPKGAWLLGAQVLTRQAVSGVM